MTIETVGYHHEVSPLEVDERQLAYQEARRAWREGWLISNREDFCARKEVDPDTGKWLVILPD